jgi:ribosomal protein S18 acetylase RimI-like enzyme
LEKNGFTFDEKLPGMAVDLQLVNKSLPEPERFSIQLAQDNAARRQWSTVVELGFGATPPNETNVNAWCRILQLANPDTIQAYTGFLDNNPVAASLLFLAAGVAGVYCVATNPEARRKGIGALLTQYPLLQARSKGYRYGTLQASEMGRGVYRSLGFQEYCSISTYFWKSERYETG